MEQLRARPQKKNRLDLLYMEIETEFGFYAALLWGNVFELAKKGEQRLRTLVSDAQRLDAELLLDLQSLQLCAFLR
jgi:hypothetical protein